MQPERSAPFYDISLYRDADVIITSSAIRSRYLAEPARFARQTAFYDSLETHYERLQTFHSNGKTGSTITIYRNPRTTRPFARRATVSHPARLVGLMPEALRAQQRFYSELGLNYETFGHYAQAVTAYEIPYQYPSLSPAFHRSLANGIVRSLLALGKKVEAIRFLKQALSFAPDDATREMYENMHRQLSGE